MIPIPLLVNHKFTAHSFMVKNPFFFVADLHIFGEFQQQNPSRSGCRLLSGEIDWLAEEKKVIEEPLVDVFFGILSLAISGTEIGGTYHIKGLCKGISQQNMALYGTDLHFRILEWPLTIIDKGW